MATRSVTLLGTLGVLAMLLLSACNGTLYVTNPVTGTPCGNEKCIPPQVCDPVSITCITPTPGGYQCNSTNLSGECALGQTCADGICYIAGDVPPVCSTGVNGYCTTAGDACVSGVCVAITPSNACSTLNIGGLCPGSETCLDGYCFRDSDNILCSPTNPVTGACPVGQTCRAGACIANLCSGAGCCSATDWTGACGTGQTCAEGVCVGPYIQPTGCSSTNLTGICSSGEVCISGTCTVVTDDTICNINNPTGICTGPAACYLGACVAVTSTNACSTTVPSGLCTNGAVCDHGVCVQTACGKGGYDCSASAAGPGSVCLNGTCTPSPLPCDPLHPNGICPGGEACVSGICGQPTCTFDNPTGACESGLVCYTGVSSGCNANDSSNCCNVGPCAPGAVSSANCPDPTNQTCTDGVCLLKPCAATSPEGSCATNVSTYNPNGVVYTMPAVCCDATLVNDTQCTLGTCSPPECSPTNVHGACGPDAAGNPQYCDPAGTGKCIDAPCTAYYTTGYCTGGLTCVVGQCKKTGCNANGVPANYCSPDVCNTVNGQCQTPPCSPTATSGTCTTGLTCCNATLSTGSTNSACQNNNTTQYGSCFAPSCSAAFPGGTCPAGQLCANNTCTALPCGATYTDSSGVSHTETSGGTCGKNYACTTDNSHNPNVYCALQPCGTGVPRGSCATGNRCVADNSNTNGTCHPYTCSATFPAGPCPTPGQVCSLPGNANVCSTPACSSTYPGGACAAGYACNTTSSGTACAQLPCSGSNPTGACPSNEVCCNASNQNNVGTGAIADCYASNHNTCVQTNCSAANPNGACVQPALNANVCHNNVCTYNGCSAAFPKGPCAVAGQVCSAPGNPNVCSTPVCSTTYPSGTCSAGQLCSGGTCVALACSTANPNGACPSGQNCCGHTTQACYTQNNNNLGHCVQLPCGTATTNPVGDPNGYCSTGGQLCCNAAYAAAGTIPGCSASTQGSCHDVTCSSAFPNGKCANANQFCVTGTCLNFCSATNPNGYCPAGYACVGSVHGQGGCATACANDFDCDTISNADEGGLNAPYIDTDGDGLPDAWDLDSDNDSIPDSVEAGDHNITTPPLSSNAAGLLNFRTTDSDGDHLSDTYEAGGTPAVPLDTDGNGKPDYISPDSDGDGILDRCEARDVQNSATICSNTTLLSSTCTTAYCLGAIDSDGDGIPDYRQLDSDKDGVMDKIEGRKNSWDATTLNPLGVDTDSDNIPDYRDLDSDNDGVLDADEDVNGNGVVDCQLDGNGAPVVDTRPTPTCNSTSSPFSSATPYNYNPVCQLTGNVSKCVLSETNRDFADTDGNGIPDGQDGIYEVCSTANLKPVNLFFSQQADYAYALEQQFTAVRVLSIGGTQVGMTFDDPVKTDGANAVSGFVLSRTPDQNAISASPNTLITKALAQSNVDKTKMSAATGVTASSLGLVINRNSTSFDGYGVVVSQYAFNSTAATAATVRDNILQALASNTLTLTPAAATINPNSPSAAAWTLKLETLYRYDGRVVVAGAVVPSGTNPNSTVSYNYRTLCPAQTTQAGCVARPGCSWTGSACTELSSYQIPLFYADNASNGSALTQYGDNVAALCESLVQKNSIVDFLWTVDSSGSMAPKIGQVSNSAALFFPILNNSEADYRVSYATTSENSPYWPPVFPGCTGVTAQGPCEAYSYLGGCSWNTTNNTCQPMCTPWNGAGNQATCLSKGCTFNTSTNQCTWGGCSALNANTNPTWVQNMCTYYDCTWNPATAQCQFTGLADRTNGAISMDFTGAIGGVTNTSAPDRSISYACSEGCASPTNNCANITTQATCNSSSYCAWQAATKTAPAYCASGATYCGSNTSSTTCTNNAYLGCAWNGTACVSNCCPACLTNSSAVPNDPACYFAARLPNDDGSGYEYGLLMTEWALNRAGLRATCASASSSNACSQLAGCTWQTLAGTASCIESYCSDGILNPNVNFVNTPKAQCNGDPNAFYTALSGANGETSSFPTAARTGNNYAGVNNAPSNCEWQADSSVCVPSSGPRCSNNATQSACVAAFNGRCAWNASSSTCDPVQSLNAVTCSATSQAICITQGAGTCQWDSCSYSTAATCNAVYGCNWSGTSCSAVANSGTCRPPLKRMMRANATPVAILVSDEEECYEKDGPGQGGSNVAYDGWCTGGQYSGSLNAYNDPIRTARVNAFSDYMESRGVLTFALTGDQANKALAPATTTVLGNGGCKGTYYNAEAGQAYIDVAESTGGGWGSLCAANLFPSTEAVVISALAKASPYKLLGFVTIGGTSETVQPISATIEVATQSCKVPSEYPNCASGTKVSVVPRSRDNGFDYDATNNTLILYGAARPVTQGSITISYRYWQNASEPSGGATNCPCPSTTAPGCKCPAGNLCGIQGSGFGTTNTCSPVTNPLTCAATPGCLWNSANNPNNMSQVGFCEADGLCAPNPTCGGITCPTGETCNPSLGLCECDPTCQSVGGCSAGSTCDNNGACSGLAQPACSGSCAWDPNIGACFSATCGKCICDTTCGGGCPVGQACNTATSSATCGQCACDTTCAHATKNASTDICNSDVNSPSCGLWEPVTCSTTCPTGFVCNHTAGYCVCDTSCGGGCPSGGICNSDTSSASCGQCGCDPTCGGSCPVGQVCDSNSTSATCGLCSVDTTCGGGCNNQCRASTSSACGALSGCRWASWLATPACEPLACKTCNTGNGVCGVDPTCCGACKAGETCNSATGACVCDTTCDGGCGAGQTCDTNTASATCGTCKCDTTCGGGCLSNEICNTSGSSCGLCTPSPTCNRVGGVCNVSCSAGTTAQNCNTNIPATAGCHWEAWENNGAGACVPIQCELCNASSGYCIADDTCCGACGPTEVCNQANGECMCDTSCGGGCSQAGFVCDSTLTSPTCGECVCDVTCGGATCPTGEICDTGTSSPTCGECVIDKNCGGTCAAPLVCNPTTGLCSPNPACGGCPSGLHCNYTTGVCVPDGE